MVRLVRDYRSTPQVVALANGLLGQARGAGRGGAGSSWSPSATPGPRAGFTEHADEPAEAAARRRADRGADRLRACRRSEIAVLYRINAQSEVYEQALADAGRPLPAARRRAVLRAARGARGGAAAARRGPGVGRRPTTRRRCRDAGAGGAPARAAGPRSRRAGSRRRAGPLGVAGRAGAAGGGLRRGPARRHPRATSSPSSTSGPARSTRRPSRASPWRRCTRPRAWSGTRCSWSAWPRARCRSPTPRPTSRSRRSAGCSTSGSPGPGVHLALSWALSRSPGGRGGRRPLPLPRRAAARRRARGRAGGDAGRRRAARGRGPRAVPGVRAHAVRGGRDQADALRGLPVGPRRGAVRAAARLAARASRAARARPAFVVFTDNTLIAIAEAMPADDAGLLAVPGVGRAKLDRYGPAVLAILAGEEPPEPVDGPLRRKVEESRKTAENLFARPRGAPTLDPSRRKPGVPPVLSHDPRRRCAMSNGRPEPRARRRLLVPTRPPVSMHAVPAFDAIRPATAAYPVSTAP